MQTAPDGFPYIGALPAKIVGDRVPGLKEYEPRALAQLALANHAGIAVYVRLPMDHPLYAYTLGAVAAIAADRWQPGGTPASGTLQPGEHLVIGTPSADALPPELRRAVAEYMRANDQVAVPKIALIVIKRASGEFQDPPWQMAANLRRSDFPTQSAWEAELKRISWFIPPPYSQIRPPLTDAGFAQWFDIVAPVAP